MHGRLPSLVHWSLVGLSEALSQLTALGMVIDKKLSINCWSVGFDNCIAIERFLSIMSVFYRKSFDMIFEVRK